MSYTKHCDMIVLLASICDNPNNNVKIVSPPSNENLRYGHYKAAAYLLDLKQRSPLSDCIVSHIRSLYPDSEGVYTGYKETNK